VISDRGTGKDLEESSCGLIKRYYPIICLEELRKTMKNIRIAGLWTEV
jgi:hypothetical protein